MNSNQIKAEHRGQSDIFLIKLPNHNIDYPSLAIPTLTGALRDAGFSVIQADINLELRDFLISEKVLREITYSFLPKLCVYLINTPDEYINVKNMLDYLIKVDKDIGFTKIEHTKVLLQYREYERVFTNTEMSVIALDIFIISSILHNIIDLSIKINDLYGDIPLSNPVVTFLNEKVHEVAKLNPRIVGFSVMDIQRTTTLWFAKKLRTVYEGKIVVGGPDISYFGETYMKNYSFIDAAFIKEGEISLVEFVTGKPLKEINGVIYRDSNNQIIRNQPMHDPDKSFFRPDFDGFPLEKYLISALPMSASRGCAWAKCKFCVHHKTYHGYYSRKAHEVVDEIEHLSNKYNTKFFHFTDDMLEFELGCKIADEIIKRNLKVSILTYVRFDKRFTDRILNKWYRGGIKIIEWGLESASPNLLKTMAKGITISNVKSILEASSEVGILNKLLMFHNYPGETPEDFQKSVSFLEINIEKRIVRPFFSIRNKLELRYNSPLEVDLRDPCQKLVPKVWSKSSDFQSKIEYADAPNYYKKTNILKQFLFKMQNIVNERNVFSINDENLTLDLIILDLIDKDFEITINCI